MPDQNLSNRNLLVTLLRCMWLKNQKSVITFLFLAITLMSATRIVLATAIIEINNNQKAQIGKLKIYCPGKYEYVTNGTDGQVDWTEFQVGLIFSFYYIGFSFGHIPGAIITIKFGPKFGMCLSLLGSSILNMCMPNVISEYDYMYTLLVQFMVGLSQGLKFPAMADLIVNWIPQKSINECVRIVFSGLFVGTLFGSLGTGLMIRWTHRWRVIFYIEGMLGIVLFGFICALCYDHPATHPYITDKERTSLFKNLPSTQLSSRRLYNIPWRRILKDPSVITLIPAQFGHDYVFFTFCTYLPKYAAEVLHLNLDEIIVWVLVSIGSLVVMTTITSLCFYYMPCCSGRRFASMSKLIFNVASFAPSIFLVAATYSGCHKPAAFTFFFIGIGISGLFHPEIRGSVFEINLPYACIILSILNIFSGMAGAVIFSLIGLITRTASPSEWQFISLISFMILNTTSTVYVIWSTARFDTFIKNNYANIRNAVFQHALEHQEYA